jgi:protein-disulfide isomerase
MCAADQEQFFEFHRFMFDIQGEPQALSRAGFEQAADALGLDLDAFEECLDSNKYNDTVRQNIAAAMAVGVNSTPTFFINDQPLLGNRPLTAFQELIAAHSGATDAN